MISVQEATKIVLENRLDTPTVEVPLNQAIGRTLRESFIADRDFPPYNRVTMDGIAIQHEAFRNGKRSFKIEGVAAAGSPQQGLSSPDCCMEVMTGSILPKAADVRYSL